MTTADDMFTWPTARPLSEATRTYLQAAVRLCRCTGATPLLREDESALAQMAYIRDQLNYFGVISAHVVSE